jgi:hypothetical protein
MFMRKEVSHSFLSRVLYAKTAFITILDHIRFPLETLQNTIFHEILVWGLNPLWGSEGCDVDEQDAVSYCLVKLLTCDVDEQDAVSYCLVKLLTWNMGVIRL